jgi:hypothetical protein
MEITRESRPEMTDHPLTEEALAELWDKHREHDVVPFHAQGRLYVQAQTAMLRAAFDAGREHERATPAEPLARTLLSVPEGHGAPHHDADQIRPDDFVMQVDTDGYVRAGRAHERDWDGDWLDENGRRIASSAGRADRPDALAIWPAPAPPAEEVELPTAHPAHLTDVEDVGGNVCAYMALDNAGDWCGVSTEGRFHDWSPQDLVAFTLPDGTRARRDGERKDGTPRFVKVEADR